MAKGLAGSALVALPALLALSSACGGGGGVAIDIRDFDTARFTFSQSTTSDGDVGRLAGEGVVDNRRQALSVTLEGETTPASIAIGRTVYNYDESAQRWQAFTEQPDGQVGFGRPYWPQFWRDAVKIQDLGGGSRPSGEATRYLLTFDPQWVKSRLRLEATGTQEPDVLRAEVEVWVDKASRYAVELTFRLELAPGAQTTKIEVASTFSDFGTEVQIEAPAVAAPTPAPTGPAPTEPVATAAPTEP